MPNDTLTVTIQIIAEDGTTETKTINITKTTTISGKITTQNVNSIYKATVTAYKSSDLTTPVATIETDDDGSYEIEVYTPGTNPTSDLTEEYTIIITKPGYLSYTVTGIQLEAGKTVSVGEYDMIAGNTVEWGSDCELEEQIDIDDLVVINNNFGTQITESNKAEKGKYDLNEDGVVNSLYRNILKENYNKKAENVEWVKP